MRNSEEYKTWSNQVKHNAKNKCKMCGSDKNLHAHHILPYRQYPKLQLDPANEICLCSKCHDLAHGGKFKWKST